MSTSLAPSASLVASSDATAEARTGLAYGTSWGAILAGSVVALVATLVLNMIGVGVGLATLNPTGTDTPGASTLSMGAGLWWVVSGIVASLAGGYLAGRLSGKPVAGTAGYHGLVSWAVTTLVVFYLLTSAVGGIVGGAFSTVTGAMGGLGNAVGGTVQTAAQAAAPSLTKLTDPLAGIEGQVRNATNEQDPAALKDAAATAIRAFLSGDAAQKQQAEEKATAALAKAQGISPDDARKQVQDYRQQYEQALVQGRQKAEQAAAATAATVSRGALFAALALILGALAGFFGGRLGAVGPAGSGLAAQRRH